MNENERKIADVLDEDRVHWDGKSRRGIRADLIAAKLGMSKTLVEAILWGLWSSEKVERTVSGTWFRKAIFDLNETQMSLFNVVNNSRPTITLTAMAAQAGISRSELRPMLDELVRIGALTLREDGWYKVNRP